MLFLPNFNDFLLIATTTTTKFRIFIFWTQIATTKQLQTSSLSLDADADEKVTSSLANYKLTCTVKERDFLKKLALIM